MIYLKMIVFALALWSLVSSCGHTIHCLTSKWVRYFHIPDFDTAVTTTMKVIRYEGGSNFTRAVDSTELVLQSPFNLGLTVEEAKDYRIVLLPQNRVHLLKDIHFGHEKRKGSPGLDSEQCEGSISYIYDGESYTQPMSVGGSGGYVVLNL